MITKKIQLVFCAHTSGHLAYEDAIQSQPPLGLLTLASYLQNEIPEINIEVIDGKLLTENEIIDRIDSDVIGFSVWFSNYSNSISLINKIKQSRPNSTIILGGPHTAYLAKRILLNNPNIDFTVQGEGEIPLKSLLMGNSPNEIPGVVFRHGKKVLGYNFKSSSKPIDINFIPIPNLKILYPVYSWHSGPKSHSMSAFPISGIRGCMRRNRCEYCSIPGIGYRTMNPQKYWDQISSLNHQYGIDFFFETGDIFLPQYLEKVASISDHPKIAMRVYSYPGVLKEKDIPCLKSIGASTIFMGVESSLIWKKSLIRKYSKNYSVNSLLQEIEILGRVGIKVIPSFVLGMNGEDKESLAQNVEIILRLKKLSNIDEVTVSTVLPLPGSIYFEWCLSNKSILNRYNEITGQDLLKTDKIDIYILSQIFVDEYTEVGYSNIYRTIELLRPKLGPGMANWGAIPPVAE